MTMRVQNFFENAELQKCRISLTVHLTWSEWGCTICTPSTKRSPPFISLPLLYAQTTLSNETSELHPSSFNLVPILFCNAAPINLVRKVFVTLAANLRQFYSFEISDGFFTSVQSIVFSQVLHSMLFGILQSEDIPLCNTHIPGE